MYNRLSLSQLCLSRMSAYLKVKIWPLFKHRKNLTIGNKLLWKRGAISPLFHSIFNISLTSGVKLNIHLWNVVVRVILPQFYKSDTLRYGLRDNESRLYIIIAYMNSEGQHQHANSHSGRCYSSRCVWTAMKLIKPCMSVFFCCFFFWNLGTGKINISTRSKYRVTFYGLQTNNYNCCEISK